MVEKLYIQHFLSDGSLNEKEEDIVCLPLRTYNETHIAVTNIEGLAPMPGTINMDDNAGGDGSIFNSARAQNRNIVITMKPFEDDMYDFDGRLIPGSMEACRRKIYLIFPLKRKIRLYLETETRKYYIDGYVETIDADYFGDMEGAQVSLLCPDPYFKVDWEDTVPSDESSGFKLLKSGAFYSIDMSIKNEENYYYLDHNIPMIIKVIITKSTELSSFSIGCGIKPDSMEYMVISGINVIEGDNIVINTKTRTVDWIGLREGRTIYRNGLPFTAFNRLDIIDYFEYYIPGNNAEVDRIGKHRLLFNNWFTFDKDVETIFSFDAFTGNYISNTNSEWKTGIYYELEGEYYVLLDSKPEGWDDPESNEYYTNYYTKESFANVIIKPILEYEGV